MEARKRTDVRKPTVGRASDKTHRASWSSKNPVDNTRARVCRFGEYRWVARYVRGERAYVIPFETLEP